MVPKIFVMLALATGFAAAKPINTPASLLNNISPGPLSLIDNLKTLTSQRQPQVLQIQSQNLQLVDNGFQSAVVQQVNEVLVIEQQQNGRDRDLNNLFRKANFARERRDEATVMLVVQQIQISVDGGRDGADRFEGDVFVQSVVVANRGARATKTVMLFEEKKLVATQVLGNGVAAIAAPTDNVVLATKTADVQLFGAQPTWSEVVVDPAVEVGGIWEAELADLQKVEEGGEDGKVNGEAAEKEAEQEKKAKDEAKKQEEEAKKAEEEAKKKEDADAKKKAEEEKKQQQGQEQKDAEQGQDAGQGQDAEQGQNVEQGQDAEQKGQEQEQNQEQQNTEAPQSAEAPQAVEAASSAPAAEATQAVEA